MRKNIFIINILLLLALLALDVAYIIIDTLALKACASAVFVVIGIINLVYVILNKVALKFAIVMMVGLVFAMLGDIILNIHFIAGAALFGIAHVFFFVAYNFLNRFSWKDIVCSLIIFIPSVLFIVLAPFFDFDGIIMEIVAVVYALIISFMVGKAVSNLIQNRNLLNIIITIGSVLFFLSDLMLLLGNFASLPVVGIICLVLYYPAEFLLAFSLFVYGDKNKKLLSKQAQNEE